MTKNRLNKTEKKIEHNMAVNKKEKQQPRQKYPHHSMEKKRKEKEKKKQIGTRYIGTSKTIPNAQKQANKQKRCSAT